MDGLLCNISPDYEFYAGTYHGTMSEDAFVSSLPDALAEVSYAVWSTADLSPFEDRVKMAVCSVADLIGNDDKRRTSYTAGKVREDYTSAGFTLTAEASIKRWLGGIGVLKRGRWL